ncbi:MAG: hypothetical protein IT161_02115 [Bryobacterales bacterium]|nr:hypothetical protein [Bryobacterales bacterium]
MTFRIPATVTLAVALAAGLAPAQLPDTRTPREQESTRLPNGRLQSDEIVKADFEQNMKDIKQMQKLLEEVRAEMEKNDRYVLSMANLKKLEEIEKLSRQVRGRMRRW